MHVQHIYLVLYLNKAYFWSYKFVESCSKMDHVVCNIKPTFISRALLHALYKMIYTVRSNIFGEIMKDRMRAVRDIPENRSRVSIWFLEDGGRLERWRNHCIWCYGCR